LHRARLHARERDGVRVLQFVECAGISVRTAAGTVVVHGDSETVTSVPSCDWPIRVVGGASKAQAGLVRCYLRALAPRAPRSRTECAPWHPDEQVESGPILGILLTTRGFAMSDIQSRDPLPGDDENQNRDVPVNDPDPDAGAKADEEDVAYEDGPSGLAKDDPNRSW
jgi:hypothetical protein